MIFCPQMLPRPFPFEPEDDITELDTDVGDAGLSVCCGEVLIELEWDVGDVMPGLLLAP
jgi:hypothetical protein